MLLIDNRACLKSMLASCILSFIAFSSHKDKAQSCSHSTMFFGKVSSKRGFASCYTSQSKSWDWLHWVSVGSIWWWRRMYWAGALYKFENPKNDDAASSRTYSKSWSYFTSAKQPETIESEHDGIVQAHQAWLKTHFVLFVVLKTNTFHWVRADYDILTVGLFRHTALSQYTANEKGTLQKAADPSFSRPQSGCQGRDGQIWADEWDLRKQSSFCRGIPGGSPETGCRRFDQTAEETWREVRLALLGIRLSSFEFLGQEQALLESVNAKRAQNTLQG